MITDDACATEDDWFKSGYSSAQGDDCVEVAVTEQAVHVRDSKDVSRPAFAVGREGRGRFLRHVVRE
ncbi:DUF397 domain-containing protein [Streptomyces radiopugnans]|uniref:DUF397 domain-containing protein n=1 Tax=Streptomyces radiopugnans TaxID=403935 RepID=A0A1H9J8I0_9ACTN|nr:DUF397 domain-containing protein [Streptomyces radiopugnans]SEQ83039.1 protein of unknown function [Streptomyces radiopugnans]